MARFLLLLVLLVGVLVPGTVAAALGTSRLYPARFAPGVSDRSQAELVSVEAGAGVEAVPIEMIPAGGQIRGRILGEGETGLVGVWVVAEAGTFEVIGLTDSDGSFSLEGVPAGDVWLRASTDNPNSREQRFAARYYPEALSRDTAQLLQVAEAQILVLPDWTLPLGSALRGEVTASDTGGSLAGIEVQLHRDADGQSWVRGTDAKGRFSFRGLTPGSYRVGAAPLRGTRYLPGWSGGARTLPEAESLQLESGSEGSVSLALNPGASIRGQLRSEGQNRPLSQILVQAIARDSRDTFETISDDFGFYELAGLPSDPDNSYLIYSPPMNQYFPSVPREEDARRIIVVEGEFVSRIDIEGFDPADCLLTHDSRGVIQGRVEIDFSRLKGGLLTAYSEEDTVHLSLTEKGFYTMDCVPVGEYQIGFVPQGPFVTQYYDEVDRLLFAEFVTVDADTADGIRFDPLEASWIAGEVRDVGGGSLPDAIITILDLDGQTVATGQSDELGSFRIDRILDGSGLPAGDYYVRAESTVVGDLDVTPVLQPTISFDVDADAAHLRWFLPDPWWWELVLHRQDLLSDRMDPLWHEPAQPRALTRWSDHPGPGRYRYRLQARAYSSEGTPESPWIEIWTEAAELRDRSSLRAWPSPWHGSGWVTFEGALSFGDGSLEIVSADGRLVKRLLWAEDERTLLWDGTNDEGRVVASGVYFLRRRTEWGRVLSKSMIVVDR